ncbi:hypothetical protein B5E82_05470 [Lachnoclostridium sp. An138]|nr:hypothetical protein B5E82_05470 [Lachnoclostridium sp. An138]
MQGCVQGGYLYIPADESRKSTGEKYPAIGRSCEKAAPAFLCARRAHVLTGESIRRKQSPFF